MDLNATKLFITVVQAGSFSAASDRTGIPISTLVRKLNELELALGVQLLERSKKGVRPTYKGQQFFEQTRPGLELLEDARKTVTSAHKLAGKLRISVPADFTLWWELLHAFQQRYPDIRVFCHSGERVVDLYEDGIDVALRLGALHTEDVIARPVMNIEAWFVATPALAERFGHPQTLAALTTCPIASWEGLNSGYFEWSSGNETVKFEPFFSSNSAQALRHYALSGAGVSLLFDFMVKADVESGKLVRLLPQSPPYSTPLHLLYVRHKHPSAITLAYLDFCTEWISQYKT
ncbi:MULTISPECIES: LysR family transcriptional regulator [Pantoea]|uniref:LysR family transcriptional regulator n=1 Tax=Pantoea TaxID=53335 RepID=UPI001914C44B|nr:LysR family transcriptional regulator [Pantoea sp. S62]MBK5013138.1 LysR family transcriptional regulator [Pantoea sp. S62]